MPKPIVFVSHVHEDAAIAKSLSNCIKNAFLEAVDVFVSSDGSSIRGGDKWMEKIENSLRDSRIVLVIISRHSVGRKWVYFETGGTFFLGARVIPLLDGSVSVNELGPPLSQLQVCLLRDPIHLHHVFAMIAEAASMGTPRIDYAEVAATVLPPPSPAEERSVIPEPGERDKADGPVNDAANPEKVLCDTAVDALARSFGDSVRKMKSSTGLEQQKARKTVDMILERLLKGDPPDFLHAIYKEKCIDQEKLLLTEDFLPHANDLFQSPDTPAAEKKAIIEWLGRLLLS